MKKTSNCSCDVLFCSGVHPRGIIFGSYWSVLELSLSAMDATNSYLFPYLFFIGKHLLVFPTAKAKKAPNSVGPLLPDLGKISMSSLLTLRLLQIKLQTCLLAIHSLLLTYVWNLTRKRTNVHFM